LAADEIGLSGYLSHINVGEIIRFLTDSLAHFTLAFGLLNVTSGTMTTISLGIISLLMLAYFYGSRIVQIGLSWLLLHMAFIYFALWTQKPELFAGRHIYQAGLGLVWAIGAGVGWWERRWAADEKEKWRRNKNRKRSFPPLRSSVPLFLRYMPLLLLTAVILSQLNITHNTQASWLHRAERYRQAEAQVKRLLPVVNSNTTVFAHSFPITPSFLPATFQVWYETTINTAVGGSLPQLQKAGQATSDYYLFDYRDEAVVNLMPELQEHSETRFLWAQDGRLEQISPDGQTTPSSDADLNPIIAGPETDLRVSIMPLPAETADTWNSIIYPATIPANSQLQLSLLAQAANTNFRVRLLGDGSEWDTLLETAESTPGQWTDITIPLNDYWQQTVILRLESTGESIWGNPRLTIDTP
jgi:hypothetical protein